MGWQNKKERFFYNAAAIRRRQHKSDERTIKRKYWCGNYRPIIFKRKEDTFRKATAPMKKYVQTTTKRKDFTFTGDNNDQRSWCFWSILWIIKLPGFYKRWPFLYVYRLAAIADCNRSSSSRGINLTGLIVWDKGIYYVEEQKAETQ